MRKTAHQLLRYCEMREIEETDTVSGFKYRSFLIKAETEIGVFLGSAGPNGWVSRRSRLTVRIAMIPDREFRSLSCQKARHFGGTDIEPALGRAGFRLPGGDPFAQTPHG